VELSPDAAGIAAAAEKGAALGVLHEGYPMKDYAAYTVRDTRNIDPADGNVDAVIVATPIERTRHAAFIATYAGHPVVADEAYRRADLAPGQIGFLVFAHGSNEIDQDFISKFGDAELVIGDTAHKAVARKTTEPSQSLYRLAPRGRQRFVATIFYRFDLAAEPDAGAAATRLRFTDATGKRFDLPIDLKRFR
jgi:hypothetical protein